MLLITIFVKCTLHTDSFDMLQTTFQRIFFPGQLCYTVHVTQARTDFCCCFDSIHFECNQYNKRNASELVENNPLQEQKTQHATVVYGSLWHWDSAV